MVTNLNYTHTHTYTHTMTRARIGPTVQLVKCFHNRKRRIFGGVMHRVYPSAGADRQTKPRGSDVYDTSMGTGL